MKKKERALLIEKKLNELYPNPKAPLNHSNAFTLLIAVLLSAQTTDKRVNIVTKDLFKLASNPEKMLKLGEKKNIRFNKDLWIGSKKSQGNCRDLKNSASKIQGQSSKKVSLVGGIARSGS